MAFVNVAAGIVTLRYLAAPTTADSGSMIQSVIALGKYSNNNALLHYILLFPILSQISSPGLNHPLYGSLRRIVEPTLFAGLCRPPRGSWRDSRCAKTISEKFLTDPCSHRVDLSWGTNIFTID